jgi:hypothetical protein
VGEAVIKDRIALCDFVRELGLTGIGCELGAGSGWFSHKILAHTNLSKVYSVDPWDKPEGSPIDFRADPTLYIECLKTLMPFGDRSYVLRTLSNEAAKLFPDGHFDFVYIDANHWEPEIRNDIATWWPKVKPGGILAGHDYCETFHLDVKRVVDEFVDREVLTLNLTECDQTHREHVIRSWFVRK